MIASSIMNVQIASSFTGDSVVPKNLVESTLSVSSEVL